MLPIKEVLTEQSCLSALVGVKADCGTTPAIHYIEQVEGCDIKSLSEIAGIQNPSGKMTAQDIIDMATSEMLGDIEFAGNGFELRETFGDICSACEFLPTYVNGGGVKIKNVILSPYSRLKIFTIEVVTNLTGDATLVIDDGVLAKTYPVTLVAGQIKPFNVNYTTSEKTVTIYFQGNAVPVGKIDCPTVRSCGCGGAVNKTATDTIRFSGIINGVDTTVQYGFKVCAAVVCDSTLLACDLIRQTPKAFALTLFYKVGEKYYMHAKTSNRINRTAGRDGDEKKDMVDYYSRLYNKRMRGANEQKSIESIIRRYLGSRRDRCVVCDAAKKESWVTG